MTINPDNRKPEELDDAAKVLAFALKRRVETEIPYQPSDWTAQCQAKCRKTGLQCPHRCRCQIPNTIGGNAVMDSDWFDVRGRDVRLCETHYRSFNLRAKQLLSLPLIDGGHLSPYNRHGYGSIVIAQDRIDWNRPVRIPKAWGVVGTKGNVPIGYFKLPRYEPAKKPATERNE